MPFVVGVITAIVVLWYLASSHRYPGLHPFASVALATLGALVASVVTSVLQGRPAGLALRRGTLAALAFIAGLLGLIFVFFSIVDTD